MQLEPFVIRRQELQAAAVLMAPDENRWIIDIYVRLSDTGLDDPAVHGHTYPSYAVVYAKLPEVDCLIATVLNAPPFPMPDLGFWDRWRRSKYDSHLSIPPLPNLY